MRKVAGMERKQLGGHFSALVTVLIWGTTFISTKVLLADFAPVEILFLRFVMGFAALYLAAPRKMEKASRRQELTFAAAGLCGVCLYYLMENIQFSGAKLEGIWDTYDNSHFDVTRKKMIKYTLLMPQPDILTNEMLEEAKAKLFSKTESFFSLDICFRIFSLI